MSHSVVLLGNALGVSRARSSHGVQDSGALSKEGSESRYLVDKRLDLVQVGLGGVSVVSSLSQPNDDQLWRGRTMGLLGKLTPDTPSLLLLGWTIARYPITNPVDREIPASAVARGQRLTPILPDRCMTAKASSMSPERLRPLLQDM
jgi:hypothetical protein